MESETGEEQVLTPNTIMWGQEAYTIEDIELDGDEVTKLQARLNEKRQHVWQRWKKEYVHGLMESHRIKRGESDFPEIGEVVLIIGDEKNRGEWKKGRVLKHIRGRDGVVRGVDLLHKGNQIQRPIQLPYKSPEGFATVVAADRIYFKGILYQAGDIVSIEDIEGDLYYAQLRGFLQDQYAQKTAVITWLIPMVPKPAHFDPALFLPGPEEDTPRPMECMEFVCRAPTELFKARREHPPFVVPRQPDLNDLATAAEQLLQNEQSVSTSI
ncbi:hypothetical protein ACROYT_G025523 [Oculina patagonica]